MSTWRGVKALIHDAIDATTHLVGEGHASVARNVRRVSDAIEPLSGPVAAVDGVRGTVTEGVLQSIRWVNRAVEGLSDTALDALLDTAHDAVGPLLPMRGDLIGDKRLVADAALGLVNGVVGDHLARVNPGLDLGFELRHGDERLQGTAPANASGRVVVLVHGLATTEWSWCLGAASAFGDPATNYGTLLARDFALTPLFARYNTGRSVPENGALFAEALERTLAAWPVPVTDVVLIGHSMGGLVCRAACNTGQRHGHAWISHLRTVISLGTPHQGAPLAAFTDAATPMLAAVDLPATRILAKILDIRSAGIRDLSHGEVGDDGDALLPGVVWHFLSGTVTTDAQHPVGRFIGDLLVRTGSAHGPVIRREEIRLETAHMAGMWHHQLQCDAGVYSVLRTWVGFSCS